MDFDRRRRRLTYIDEEQNINQDAILAAADPDIGFTIINAKDKDDYLYCYLGDSSPQIAQGKVVDENERSPEDEIVWKYICEIMSQNEPIFSVEKFEKITDFDGGYIGEASKDSCAFNQ